MSELRAIFSGLELDILVTQSQKCLLLKGISNQFPLKYTVVKCQYKLLSLSFIAQLHFMNHCLYIESEALFSNTI